MRENTKKLIHTCIGVVEGADDIGGRPNTRYSFNVGGYFALGSG